MATLRTGIGRPIDPRLPSNLRALVISVLAGVAAGTVGLIRSGDLGASIVDGLVGGAGAFAAWATAREIDHDDPRGATVGAVLAGVAIAALGRPSLAIAFGLMLAARLALRSTGLAPSLVDQLVVVGLGVFMAGSTGGWAAAMVLAVVLAREGSRPEEAASAGRFTGFGLALLATARHALAGSAWEIAGPIGIETWAVAGLAVLGFAFMSRRPPAVFCDQANRPPRPSDQFVARLALTVGAVLATVLDASAVVAIPSVAALAGVAAIGRIRPIR